MNSWVGLWLAVALGVANTRFAVAQDSVAPSATQPPAGSGRYTLVRGTVRQARTNRPLAGVLLAVESCSFG